MASDLTDPARIPYYMAASTLVLMVVIWCVATARNGRQPRFWMVAAVAAAVSVVGILLAKFGANFGLPWQIYYTAPMLATVFAPPLMFRFSLVRATAYVALAFATAPLIHAAFFYGLGWGDYMPFLRLPAL